VRRPSGVWYLDADYRAFGVTVEVNGSQHDAVAIAERDDHRRNVLGTCGRLVLTVSSHLVRHQSDVAVAITAAGLLSRGWQPGRGVRRRLEVLAARARVDLRTGDLVSRTGGRPA
jgi:hypothetical protein